MTGSFFHIIPSKLYFQFPFDPVFRFGHYPEPVDGFQTSLIHQLITPEKFVDKHETIIDANGFFEVLDWRIC
jgi:hypothetical protein